VCTRVLESVRVYHGTYTCTRCTRRRPPVVRVLSEEPCTTWCWPSNRTDEPQSRDVRTYSYTYTCTYSSTMHGIAISNRVHVYRCTLFTVYYLSTFIHIYGSIPLASYQLSLARRVYGTRVLEYSEYHGMIRMAIELCCKGA
jgi:hypothetical protein